MRVLLSWVVIVVVYCSCSCRLVCGFGFEDWNDEFETQVQVGSDIDPLTSMVNLTLIQGANATQAVCEDGTLPGYHLDKGFGAGANSWLIHLEGGGWCNNRKTCLFRKTTRRGSSNYMDKQIPFTGILSNQPQQNPDFFNWNRVKLRYCDGASFAGDSQDKVAQIQYRGQRIWVAAMQELMSKGMKSSDQALLSGCSAGGLASILHCDQFRALFPSNVTVKCLSDAGLFLDATDVSGGHALRDFYNGVVAIQGVAKNLPQSCTNHLDSTSCFFPQNLINNIKTPLFILNSAYDYWQISQSLAPKAADPKGEWAECKKNLEMCSPSQIQVLQDFRNQMLSSLDKFAMSEQNGMFINSCLAHCQSERQDTWFAEDSPLIGNKTVAVAVGDWYFERSTVKAIDCPYPCDKSCHKLA